MRYPTVSAGDLEQAWGDALDNPASMDLARLTKWVGTGEDLETEELDELASKVERERERGIRDGTDPDLIEGEASKTVYATLADKPLELLDDPGFWRYLTVAHLSAFTIWRQPSAFKPVDTDEDDGESAPGPEFNKYRTYVDGRNHAECVPLRMFIRGRLASDAGDPDLAAAAKEMTDIWRSHIVRVRTSYWPHLAAAYMRQQKDDDKRLNTDDVREQAKRLNRLNSNIVIMPNSNDEADEYLENLR